MTDFEDKVISLLETINDKLDKVMSGGSAPAPAPAAAEPSSEPSGMKPSDLVEKQEQAERDKEAPPLEGRRSCPDCGGTNFRTEEDRSQVLSMMGGIKIYKKRYICKSCGGEAPN